jgi:hypothetical protein
VKAQLQRLEIEPAGAHDQISPSSTQRCGSCILSGSINSG